MKKSELAKRIANERRISQAKAADCIDSAVHQILKKLRCGEPASLPGLGTLTPGAKPGFRKEQPPNRRRGK
ncbi:MAG: HU family DNA-binding protein [Bryobacteraceae bacterium]|nr:HU family DNA-binding protein [Bryobacteraceae bacterium]